MNNFTSQLKLEALLRRQAMLKEQYDAANTQYDQELNAVNKVQIGQAIKTLERQLREVDEEFGSLVAVAPQETLNVQVAVIAMTRAEARELEAAADRDGLKELEEALRTFQVGNLVDCYGIEYRDDWMPIFKEPRTPIRTIIGDIRDQLNRSNLGKVGRPAVEVTFLSDDFLSQTDQVRYGAWDAFVNDGGVLVVDAISMYHRRVSNLLVRSQLISPNNSVAMVVLSPLHPDKVTVNRLIRSRVIDEYLDRAFNLFTEHPDTLYQFGIADSAALQRWLYATLPNIRRTALNSDGRAAVRREAASAAAGIAAFVTGRSSQ